MSQQTQLAILGGQPIRSTPFPPWPSFGPDEIAAATAVLESGKVNYWTGSEGRLFEQEYATSVGARFGIALANGTVALELALYALGIGPGDDVVTTCRTFIASASCIVMRGACPILADVDPDSQNITAETIAAVLTPRTKAIIVVHLAGWPCDMDPIIALAKERGLWVIEDCAQAHGATYKGRPVGSLGDVAAFSFCQDKIMTTGGEGGMLTTNSQDIWRKAWSFKDHGKNYDAYIIRQFPPKHQQRVKYDSFGTNMRMTEMQSALGRVLLLKLPAWIETRRGHAKALADSFEKLQALRVPRPSADFGHSYYKFFAFVRLERLNEGWTTARILDAINAEGVPCYNGGSSEIYLENAFTADMRPAERLPIAKELGETSLQFLVHPTLTPADIADICLAVEKVMTLATVPAAAYLI